VEVNIKAQGVIYPAEGTGRLRADGSQEPGNYNTSPTIQMTLRRKRRKRAKPCRD
jgi:hypothetical protein